MKLINKLGTILLFLTISLGQLQRIQITTQIALYIHECILALLFLVNAKSLFFDEKNFFSKILKKRPVQLFFLLSFLQLLLITLFRFDVVTLLYIVRLVFYMQLVFLLKIFLQKNFITNRLLANLVIISTATIALLGIAQYLFIPDTRWLVVMGWDDHYYRLISTLFDPGFTGLILSIGFLIFIYLCRETKLKLYHIGIGSLFLVSILLTYSRATYLAVFIGLIYLLHSTKKKWVIFIIIALLAAIPFLPRPASEGVKLERTASILSRIDSNQRALGSLSLTEVIWGKGFYSQSASNSTNIPNHATTPDNSFIFAFVSLGIIGTLLLLSVLFQYRNSLAIQPFAIVFVTVSVHSLFNNALFYIFTLIFLSAIWNISRNYGRK